MHLMTIAHDLARGIMRKSVDSKLCGQWGPYRALTTFGGLGERCVVVCPVDAGVDSVHT